MFESRPDRRKLLTLALLALLGACQVVPKAPPQTPPPVPAPSETLPSDTQRQRIALLVPMSGPDAAVGQSVANAANMALLDTEARTLRVTTYDTAADPAAAAAKALAEGNRLILGPLSGTQSGPVAAAARNRGVPLIGFSGDAQLAGRGVFVMGTTPETAIARVVNYARAHGSRRFALLAPKGDYGARASAAYAAAIQSVGGELVGSESYDRTNTSVISAAGRLRARGGFDAVLIADSARIAALAAPRLKAAGDGLPRILGTELWSGDSAVAATPALRGAWFAAVSDTRFAQFTAAYKARFASAPYRQATMGYDGVLLAVRIAREWPIGKPFPTARLLDKDGYLGLDGPFRFTAAGLAQRALEVREVRAGGLGVVSPAPDRFAD